MVVLRRCFAVVLLLYIATGALAVEPFRPLKTSLPPVIDGQLDDPAWASAPVVRGFTTYTPDWGKPQSEQTEVLMAYDDENLYFAFRCLDVEPWQIKASVTSRDNMMRDDWVCINLDSFNDQQGLYAFYVNPLGIQGDSRATPTNEDRSFDLVWYSAGVQTADGYTVEISIPTKSIRFSERKPVRMGVVFERFIARRTEGGTNPALDPAKGTAWLTQMHPLVYDDITPYRVLEILPALTYSHRDRQEQGSLISEERKGEFGITGKYGVTQDLILDATYNPDFSQVEADAGQVDVNLRYSLFYPEKRPFFLEGSDQFAMAENTDIVYTRTIASPLIGAKLSGKLAETQTIAALYALDEPAPTAGAGSNPRAHFGILRYKKGLAEDSYLGGLGALRETNERGNRVGGLDGVIRLGESSTIAFAGFLSQTLQKGATSADGDKADVAYRYQDRSLGLGASVARVSNLFAADMGFVQRTGIFCIAGTVSPRFYPSSDIVRQIVVSLDSKQTRDLPSGLWETSNILRVQFLLGGTITAMVRGDLETEVYAGGSFNTNGVMVGLGGQVTKDFYLSLTAARNNAIYYVEPSDGFLYQTTLNVRYQPWETLTGEYTFTYDDFFRASNRERLYQYAIHRFKGTYQPNRYLFFRAIAEYNDFRKQLLTDFLVSFTYIPGTVLQAGYGSIYEKILWENDRYVPADGFLRTRQAFFFKASYRWIM